MVRPGDLVQVRKGLREEGDVCLVLSYPFTGGASGYYCLCTVLTQTGERLDLLEIDLVRVADG